MISVSCTAEVLVKFIAQAPELEHAAKLQYLFIDRTLSVEISHAQKGHYTHFFSYRAPLPVCESDFFGIETGLGVIKKSQRKVPQHHLLYLLNVYNNLLRVCLQVLIDIDTYSLPLVGLSYHSQ